MSKQIKVVKMPNVYERYIIVNPNTGEILDDVQGYGYRSPQKAHIAWNYKHPSSKSTHNRKINKQYLKAHKHLIDDWDACILDIYKKTSKKLLIMISKTLCQNTIPNFQEILDHCTFI